MNTRTLTPEMRADAKNIAQATAHGITRTGMARVEGRHLSETAQDITPCSLDEKARLWKLQAARELNRSATFRNEAELLQALQNVHAACDFKSDYLAQLLDLMCDIDAELNTLPPEVPEAYSGRERGEFDSMTKGVRNGY